MKDRSRQARTTVSRVPTREAVGLYRRAFKHYGSRALWNIRQLEDPTVAEILAITRQLRTEGDMSARRLAEEIEEAAGAHH
jgi:hypothetical protein